jgi:ribosomal peptide maturation radical SAM protein 1
MNDQPVDIALVRMPYSEIGQPSLALGLLKAACEERGLSNRVLPANLWFAEELGPAINDLIFESYSTTLVGEWTFAGVLFPDFQPDDELYLRKVEEIFRLDSSVEWRYLRECYPYLDYLALLREIRRRAQSFVDRMVDKVLALQPRIVGCTSTFQQHCASLSLLRAIKQRRPEVVTMIGGANCEAEMGRATFEQFPFLDYVVSGEADSFFAPMCEALLEKNRVAPLPEMPAGVWGPQHRANAASVREACQGLIDGAPVARLDDMNESPIPNYDDYFSALKETVGLSQHLLPALPFQTARGCWWGEKTHCSFCGISRTAMKFRPKTGANVMDQMVAMRDRYGINIFQGTEYIFDYRFFTTLLPRLKELKSIFRFEVKANLKVEQLQAFIDSGTVEVQPGVESLHDGILGLLRKGTTAFQNVMLLRRGRGIGLSIYWNLLHGVPGDRDEWYGEMADLIPLLHHLQSPVGFAQIHYDRFSPYWREPEKHGLTLQPAFGYEHVYPFPKEVLKDMAYFFETPRQRDAFLRYNHTTHAGLLRLTEEVHRWKTAFHSAARPRLIVTDLGDRLVFEDTRAVATQPLLEVEGLEREVYLAADEGLMPATLLKRLEGSRTAEAVQAAVQGLMEKKVLVNLSGRLVSLGVTGPETKLLAERIDRPRAEMNPTHAKLMADLLLDQKRPSIALSCLRLPHQESLSGWMARLGGSTQPDTGAGSQPAPA